MATNLRLRPDAEEAVRAEAARTGKSQQDVIREAVDRYLGLAPMSERLRSPRSAYREPEPVALGERSSTELLARDDRV